MPEQTESKGTASANGIGKHFKRRGFRFLGLDLQQVIHYFFGGNASLAIIILLLICFFLAREAFNFLPSHRQGLEDYRLAGQEFVDLLNEELDAHQELYSTLNVGYFSELNRTSLEEEEQLRAYRTVLANVKVKVTREKKRLDRRLEDFEEKQEALDDLAEDVSPAEQAAAAAALEAAASELEDYQTLFREKVLDALDQESTWDLGVGKRVDEEIRLAIAEAALEEATSETRRDPDWVAALKATSKEKKATVADEISEMKDRIRDFRAAIGPIKDIQKELRLLTLENKALITSFNTAPDRRAALLEGARNAATEEDRARFQRMADEVVIEEPDYEANNRPIYDAIPEYERLIPGVRREIAEIYEGFNKEQYVTDSGRERFDRSQILYRRLNEVIDENSPLISQWRHDESLGFSSSVPAFLLGQDWITNSSWHDFYGLLPLLTGSLLIALVALSVAVPFSVAAAIYINQLSTFREQTFVKPAIEFIEAIPSVVLGFFGILVFGEALRNVSQVEWLSWVPGFPMSERLNILTAGLLLAFMAVPTIFTLTEDAINNVPSAFTENSLALGATKLQTVFRVVVPTSASGVFAAVLLGFGRIIGETMVVLLVAGNKIMIPDFTQGIGVFVEPTHTLTGIIAQEMGEVDYGSIHYRALFMVGMVLFFFSLIVNFSAQQILKRFQRI
ncbi:MAG: phosphate ABC transporter permease subunit PstC [Verrucomicrobiota bacterium]